MERSARMVVALAALVGVGCTADNPLPPLVLDLTARVEKLESLIGGDSIAAEAEARKRGDAETLTAANEYTDLQIQVARVVVADVLNAEIARAQAAEVALKQQVGTIMEPRLVGPGEQDLGRWLAPTVAYVDAISAVRDYAGQDGQSPREVYYTGGNCTGDTFILSLRSPVGTAISSRTGTMWVTTGKVVLQQLVVSYFGQGGCKATNGNLVADAQPVRDSRAGNLAFTPDQLHLELRPAARQ